MAKRKKTVAQRAVGLLPGVLRLGLIGLGLMVIMAVHAGGQNSRSRAGLVPIVIGMVVLMAWAFSNKSDGYNF